MRTLRTRAVRSITTLGAAAGLALAATACETADGDGGDDVVVDDAGADLGVDDAGADDTSLDDGLTEEEG